MFDSTNEWRNEPHFFRCKSFFRSLFVTHANLPALFPLMRVRSDYMKKSTGVDLKFFVDPSLLSFFFFSIFWNFCSIKLKHEEASVYFVLRYYGILVDLCCTFSSSALNVFSFVFFSHEVLFISVFSVLPSSISLYAARVSVVSRVS